MRGNSYLVCGDSYKSAYEYRDFVTTVDLNYLECCAVVCIVRWCKEARQLPWDINKALHYLNKLEAATNELRVPRGTFLKDDEIISEVSRFTEANGLGELESRFVQLMAAWRTKEELEDARGVLFSLLDVIEGLDEYVAGVAGK